MTYMRLRIASNAQKSYVQKQKTSFRRTATLGMRPWRRMIKMVERTYYFPADQIGRYILNYIIERVGCAIGDIHRVADFLAVPISARKSDVSKIENILKMYELM